MSDGVHAGQHGLDHVVQWAQMQPLAYGPAGLSVLRETADLSAELRTRTQL